MIPDREKLTAKEVLFSEKKKVASMENLYPATLVSDYALVLLVANWPRVGKGGFDGSLIFEPVKDQDDWDTLWDLAVFDLEDVAVALGTNLLRACSVFEQAVLLRIIFPDGTVPEEARKAAKGLAMAAIEVARKKGFAR